METRDKIQGAIDDIAKARAIAEREGWSYTTGETRDQDRLLDDLKQQLRTMNGDTNGLPEFHGNGTVAINADPDVAIHDDRRQGRMKPERTPTDAAIVKGLQKYEEAMNIALSLLRTAPEKSGAESATEAVDSIYEGHRVFRIMAVEAQKRIDHKKGA